MLAPSDDVIPLGHDDSPTTVIDTYDVTQITSHNEFVGLAEGDAIFALWDGPTTGWEAAYYLTHKKGDDIEYLNAYCGGTLQFLGFDDNKGGLTRFEAIEPGGEDWGSASTLYRCNDSTLGLDQIHTRMRC